MKILQIIPHLRPVTCGVGDYAHELAREWRRHGVETTFLGGDPAWPGGDTEFPGATVTARSSAALHSSLAKLHARDAFDAVVLQFSGYGYATRGAPVWLLRGLQSWLHKNPAVQMVTMFHELYASGPVTSSAFWLNPLQKWICSCLARLSKFVLTNRTASAAWLADSAPQHRDAVLAQPVFSNLGELAQPAPPSARPAHLVMFGHQVEEWPLLQTTLSTVVRALQPRKLTVLRRRLQLPVDFPQSVEVVQNDVLPYAEASGILQSARYGLHAYHPAYLGKSGILAAYLAHGVVPLLVNVGEPLSEGLEVNAQVLSAQEIKAIPPLDFLDNIALAGRRWYDTHSIAATARSYLEQIAAR